jgi:hypothetical protein
MIADTARVAMRDGTTKAAVDLFPQAQILTFRNQKLAHTVVEEKKIQNHDDVICLILANGTRLLGSRDQRVCVCRDKKAWYSQMADIEIGTTLRGQAAGVLTNVKVIGILYFQKHEMRLVELSRAKNDCFIAEGVLCR